jgi:hypothetical protein
MTPKKPKGALKFHQDWEMKYAVQICTRDPVTKDVLSAVCLMCTNFGRDSDESSERKRKRTANDKYYTAPWRTDNFVSQLIGIVTDGASTMTGCMQGMCSCLSNKCHSRIFRIWCVVFSHQPDLVMKRAFNKLCNEKFLDTLTSVTGHLRRQQNLIADMKSTCPTFVTTWWLSMGKLLKWLIDKRV